MGRYLEEEKEEHIWYGVQFGHNVRNMQRQYKKKEGRQIETRKWKVFNASLRSVDQTGQGGKKPEGNARNEGCEEKRQTKGEVLGCHCQSLGRTGPTCLHPGSICMRNLLAISPSYCLGQHVN